MALPPQAELAPVLPLNENPLLRIRWDPIKAGDLVEIERAIQLIDENVAESPSREAIIDLFDILETIPIPIDLTLRLFDLKSKFRANTHSINLWFKKGLISVPDSLAMRGKLLFSAIRLGSFKLADAIVEKARSEERLLELAHFRDEKGNTLLHAIVQYGDVSRIKWAIGIGVDLNGVNHKGLTALDVKMDLSNLEIVDELFKYKPNTAIGSPFERLMKVNLHRINRESYYLKKVLEGGAVLTPKLRERFINQNPDWEWRIHVCEKKPGYDELYRVVKQFKGVDYPTHLFSKQWEKLMPLWAHFIETEKPSEKLLPYAVLYFFALEGKEPEKGWKRSLEMMEEMSLLKINSLDFLTQLTKKSLFTDECDPTSSLELREFLTRTLALSNHGKEVGCFLSLGLLKKKLPPFESLDELEKSLSHSLKFDLKTLYQLEDEGFPNDLPGLRTAFEKLNLLLIASDKMRSPADSKIKFRLSALIHQYIQLALQHPLSTKELISIYELNHNIQESRNDSFTNQMRAGISEGRFPDIDPIEMLTYFMDVEETALCHALWKRTDPRLLQQANKFWIHDFFRGRLFKKGKEWLTDILKVIPIDQPNQNGMTPLGLELNKLYTENAVEYLLEQGANPNCPSEEMFPIDIALMHPPSRNDVPVRRLIEKGADVSHFSNETVEKIRKEFPDLFLKIFKMTHPKEAARLNALDLAKKSLKKPLASLAHQFYDRLYRHPDLIERLAQFDELDSIEHPFLKLLFIQFPQDFFSQEEIEEWSHLLKDEQLASATAKSIEILMSFCEPGSDEMLRFLKKADPFSEEVQAQLKEWGERASFLKFFKPKVMSGSAEKLVQDTDLAFQKLIDQPDVYEIFQELRKKWPSPRGWEELKFYLSSLMKMSSKFSISMKKFLEALLNDQFPEIRYQNSPQLKMVFKKRPDLEVLWKKTGIIKEVKPPKVDHEKKKELKFSFTRWLVDQINDPNHFPPHAIFKLASLIPSFLDKIQDQLRPEIMNIESTEEWKLFDLCHEKEWFEPLLSEARNELAQLFHGDAASILKEIPKKIQNLIPEKNDKQRNEKVTQQAWLRLMADLIQFNNLEKSKFSFEAWKGSVQSIGFKCQNKALGLSESLFAKQLGSLIIQWRDALAKNTVLVGKVSDHPADLLLMGTEMEGSCQKIQKDHEADEYNGKLSHMILNGNSQVALLADEETDKIAVRAILRFAFDPEENLYLFKETTYPKALTKEDQQYHNDVIRERARVLNLPLAASDGSLFHGRNVKVQDLKVHPCNVPREYIDASYAPLPDGGYIIKNATCEIRPKKSNNFWLRIPCRRG